MARTIEIDGSDEVIAELGDPGVFYMGKWQDIKITKVGEDEDIPLNVRKSLIGLTIPTIFSKEQLESQGVKLPISNNSRLAYAPDVVDALNTAEKYNEAKQLENIAPNVFDMYVAEGGIYDLV